MAASTSKEEDVITEINVTPLVDVCLVLVIIFMAVAPFAIQAGLKVLQTQSKVGVGKVAASENVQIRLTEAGILTVNGKPSGRAQLFQDLVLALAVSRDKVVILTADSKNRVKEVVPVLDIAKQAGASKVAMMKSER